MEKFVTAGAALVMVLGMVAILVFGFIYVPPTTPIAIGLASLCALMVAVFLIFAVLVIEDIRRG